MIVQVLFGERYILQRHGVLAALEFQKLVNPNPTHYRFQCKWVSAESPLRTPADKNSFVFV
jgi:hypothetical protein